MLFEEKLIFFPTYEFEATPESLALEHEELSLRTADGRRIHGWFLPAPCRARSASTVLYCHGNAGNISDRLERTIRMHTELGVDVLLFDYGGFGRSEGRPGEAATYEDGLAAYRYLAGARRIDPRGIVLFGESLGAAVAIEIATRVPAASLVIEAPFTSIRAMARVVYPFLPVRGFLRTRYDNLAKISGLRLPLLVIHGTRDPTVPYAQGEDLYREARAPKELLAVEGAGHTDSFVVGGDRYWEAWRRILGGLEKVDGPG